MKTQDTNIPTFQHSNMPMQALGLMSGTSLDGVDVVSLTTDGENHIQNVQHHYRPYPRGLFARVQEVATSDVPLLEVLRVEKAITQEYAAAIIESGFLTAGVQVVGCHGQTIRHLPHEGLTWQLGDASLLAERLATHTGHPIPVVMDFRRRDLAAGGEGAPLVPLFHAAMLGQTSGTHAILNIGGVANVSVISLGDEARLTPHASRITASDCGPGMGLLDQWVHRRTGAAYDEEGRLAQAGQVDNTIIQRAFAELPFFQRPVPRSADRYEFNAVLEWIKDFSTEHGAATLAALTVAGIGHTLTGMAHGAPLQGLYLAGGGPKNQAVAQGLQQAGWPVKPVQQLGWQPLHVEAACFAWLAVRRLRGLPFTLPGTTGCQHPTVGGLLTA